MANITYRVSDAPTLPGASTVKSAPLTNLEVDANFKVLDNGINSTNTAVSSLTTVVSTKADVSDVLAFSIALG